MNIGERLKIVRQLYRHSQAVVAGSIGINPKTYQAYERGRAETPISVLMALSDFYGYYSIDLLLGLTSQIEYCESLLRSYIKATPEKRKIVDYILSLNN